MQFTNQLGVFELMVVFKLKETYRFFEELYTTTKESSIYLVQKLSSIKFTEKKSHSPREMDTYTYNFASLYGGSFILSKSEQLENVGNILQDSKESYMMTECGQTDQFIVISLKEEIQLETVMFINQELFSSTIHHFQLFGSVVYPTNEWEYLGTFIAEDNNHWQNFTLQPHFLRYLRIHINDFYSAEFHCIVTQVKVFGQTVIGDLVQSHKQNLFKLKNTNEPHFQKSIQNISSINDNYTPPHDDEDDTMIQEYYESTSQCTYLDYFYLKTHQKQENDKYIRIVPYAANQSVFKVTSQNILIISHNQDLQKQSINQLEFNIDQQFKITQELDKSQTKLLKEIEHQKSINQYLQDQLETYKHIFLISILIIIVINSAILIIVCNHQVISNKKFKKSTKSAISLRSNQELFSDDENNEAKTPIVKSMSNGNGNHNNQGKNNHRK